MSCINIPRDLLTVFDGRLHISLRLDIFNREEKTRSTALKEMKNKHWMAGSPAGAMYALQLRQNQMLGASPFILFQQGQIGRLLHKQV